MGGLAVSHLARRGKVDFAFLDRTFSAIENVPS